MALPRKPVAPVINMVVMPYYLLFVVSKLTKYMVISKSKGKQSGEKCVVWRSDSYNLSLLGAKN
jgi:hypothetical protein